MAQHQCGSKGVDSYNNFYCAKVSAHELSLSLSLSVCLEASVCAACSGLCGRLAVQLATTSEGFGVICTGSLANNFINFHDSQ